MIVQFGIATFRHVPFENTYETECFNVYLFPQSIPLKNKKISWQVTSLNFLCKHNFDFNKVSYDNITWNKTYLFIRLGSNNKYTT